VGGGDLAVSVDVLETDVTGLRPVGADGPVRRGSGRGGGRLVDPARLVPVEVVDRVSDGGAIDAVLKILLNTWRQRDHGGVHRGQVPAEPDVDPARSGEGVPGLELDPRIADEPAVDRRGGGEVAIYLTRREARRPRQRHVHEEVLRVAPVRCGRYKEPV